VDVQNLCFFTKGTLANVKTLDSAAAKAVVRTKKALWIESQLTFPKGIERDQNQGWAVVRVEVPNEPVLPPPSCEEPKKHPGRSWPGCGCLKTTINRRRRVKLIVFLTDACPNAPNDKSQTSRWWWDGRPNSFGRAFSCLAFMRFFREAHNCLGKHLTIVLFDTRNWTTLSPTSQSSSQLLLLRK
jgi:hypothetical protein